MKKPNLLGIKADHETKNQQQRRLVKEHVKYSVLPLENKAKKENMNKKKNPAMKAIKNGNEGQNDAQVLKNLLL